jgi:hypothetical protein
MVANHSQLLPLGNQKQAANCHCGEVDGDAGPTPSAFLSAFFLGPAKNRLFIGGSTTLYEKKNVSIELAEVRVSPYADGCNDFFHSGRNGRERNSRSSSMRLGN